MIQALESAYGNPNELSEALDRLQRLQFTVNGKTDIVDFLAEFDYLTATGHNSLLTKTRDESVTYEVFCGFIKDAVHCQKRSMRQTQDSRSSDRSRRAPTKTAPTTAKTPNKTGSTPITSRDAGRALTDDEKRAHWDNGTCFICGKTGHLSRECPDRTHAVSRVAFVPVPANDSDQDSKRIGPSQVSLMVPKVSQIATGYIQKQLVATFVIDGRSFANETFDIAECGHDIFIGLFWMREKRLLLDCAARQIIWPDDLPASPSSPDDPALVKPRSGRIDPKIQADAERRNRLLEKEEKRYRILHKNWRRSDQAPPASVLTRYRLRLRRFSPSLRLPRSLSVFSSRPPLLPTSSPSPRSKPPKIKP
ncbi:hypothetical protein HRG_008811 [Hirsutella rhossiliensis]